MVWMILILPQISNPSNHFSSPWGYVPIIIIIIGPISIVSSSSSSSGSTRLLQLLHFLYLFS